MRNQLISKQFLAIIVVAAIAFCLGLSQVAAANAQVGTGVIRVALTGSDTTGCGSEGTPCATIQFAVNTANSGETIRLAAGTYTGSGAAVLVVDSDTNSTKTIIIEGGYSTSNWNTYNPTANVTIIDGQDARRGVYFDARNKGGSVTLKGITIQNGLVTGNASYGGGLYCVNSGTVTLTDVLFSDNVAQGNAGSLIPVTGGGASFYKCNLTLSNVTFNNNQVLGGNATPRGAQALGGGLFVTDNSTIQANHVTFSNNTATAGSGGRGYNSSASDRADALGGGAAIQFSTGTLNNIIATGNVITAGSGSVYGGFADGGGLFFEASTITINDGLFQGNLVTGGASPTGTGGEGEGGAIMAINKTSGDSRLTLNRLKMINHTTKGGNAVTAGRANGGAMTLIGTQATATNLIIADNVANAGTGKNQWGGGGGIYISRGTNLTLNHATLARNSVLSTMIAPGLIVLDGSVATVNYSIFSDHSGSGSADGTIIALSSTDRITLNYTLFWNNTLNIDNNGSGKVTNNNAFSGDPAYVSAGLPNYNYHLTTTSAAKDKATGSATTLDIDQDPRPYGSVSDVGADELAPPLALSSKSVSPIELPPADGPNHQVTYTLIVRNDASVNVTGATLTDPLPVSGDPQVLLDLASGPTCSGGTCNYNSGSKTISWSGNVNAGQQVTIAYVIDVNFPTSYSSTRAFSNTASVQYSSGGENYSHTILGVFFINPNTIFLPVVIK